MPGRFAYARRLRRGAAPRCLGYARGASCKICNLTPGEAPCALPTQGASRHWGRSLKAAGSGRHGVVMRPIRPPASWGRRSQCTIWHAAP